MKVLELSAMDVVGLMLTSPWGVPEIVECLNREGEDRTADVEESIEIAIEYLQRILEERF